MEFEMQISNPQGGQFLRRIEWNKDAFEAQINQIAERYQGELQISSPEDMKRAKEDRAEVNKILKAIDERRKEVKAAIMEPYDIFEGEVKDCTQKLTEARNAIDEQVKEFETRQKLRKIAEIRLYWERHEARVTSKCAFSDLTAWEKIYRKEWEQARYSIKKACEDIDAAFETAKADLTTIEQMDVDRTMKNILAEHLVKTGDIREVLAYAARIREQEEARKRQEEEAARKAREAQEAKDREYQEAWEKKRQQSRAEAAAKGMEALRERLNAGIPQDSTGDAQDGKKQATAAESHEGMPAAGPVRGGGYSNDATDADTAIHDAPDSTGQAPGTAEAPREPEKIYKAAFWVSGTREQLQALAAYIKNGGFAGYGSVKS